MRGNCCKQKIENNKKIKLSQKLPQRLLDISTAINVFLNKQAPKPMKNSKKVEC